MGKLVLNRDFIFYVKSLVKLNDSIIISSDKEQLSCLVGTPDNVAIAHGLFPCSSEFDGFLNIPSITKLIKALDQIDGEVIEFTVNNNNIVYKSPKLRFKYHLLDNGIISQPALSIKKIQDFTFDISFKVKHEQFVELNKFSTFNSDSNKIYLYGDGKNVFADLTDRARDNIDSLQFQFAEYAEAFDAQSFKLDFFRSLSLTSNSDVTININSTLGVLAIDIINPHYKLKYITTSFTS